MKIKFNISSILAQLLLLSFVIVWIAPTFGLFISSFRDKDKLAISGWWTSLTTVKLMKFIEPKAKRVRFRKATILLFEIIFSMMLKAKK